MTPATITIAILMLGVGAAAFLWLRGNLADGSDRRRSSMMERIGLNPEAAGLGRRRTRALLKETRQRCQRCSREDLCERWLAGEVEGANAFCPNAAVFSGVVEHGGRAV